MAHYTRDIGARVSTMAKGPTLPRWVQNTTENGRTESTMVSARSSGQMGLLIKGSGKTAGKMAAENLLEKEVPSMKASGSKVSTTAEVSFRLMKVKYSQELLKMASFWVD